MERPPVALVLSGAAALGAYQVGVLDHLVTDVADELGGPLRLDVISGTSAGAINGAAMASGADLPAAAVERLADAWTGMRLDDVLRPSAVELLAMIADLAAVPERLQRALVALGARGGLVGIEPIAMLCRAAVQPALIEAHLASGALQAVAIAATRVATGRATVFYRSRAPLRSFSGPTMSEVQIAPEHALASAAVPLLFPAVEIAGELYCDGGLRHLVPLSPAIHLGARRVLMVSAMSAATAGPAAEAARRASAGSPLYLAGKALDALFTDSVDGDLDRLLQLNRVLEAGARRYGPGFASELDGALAELGAPPLRPIELVHLRPSQDLGALAAAYLAGASSSWLRGPVARGFRRLVERDAVRAGGVLSYLLFDGGFASELIALGRADARGQHAALVGLFADVARAA
jgi:NTE family protein